MEQQDDLLGTLRSWLGQLGTEVGALAVLAHCGQVEPGDRQFAGRALQYWAHCIELPIDGIEDLRLLDIALVLRTLADFSGAGEAGSSPKNPSIVDQVNSPPPDHAPPNEETSPLTTANSEVSLPVSEEVLGLAASLRADAPLVRRLLGEDYQALARYVSRWVEQQGAEVDAPPASTQGQSLEQRAVQWSQQYAPPRAAIDENTLIKVQAFGRARYAEG